MIEVLWHFHYMPVQGLLNILVYKRTRTTKAALKLIYTDLELLTVVSISST